MFAVIMAGGGGTRLWPKSREQRPKQMHALIGDKPLVHEMADRLQHILGFDNVYIIANEHHAKLILESMPYMKDRIIVDPYRRDTGPCIGLAAIYLSRIDPDAIMGVFPADPFIGSETKFGEAIHAAEALAKQGNVVTVGIRPSYPETGYGYIKVDGEYGTINECNVFKVSRFVEKPSLETAAEYCKSGDYLWNSGMFVWSVPTVLDLYRKHLPNVYERLMRIKDAIGSPIEKEVVDSEYKQMEKISVDYGIMEKLSDILVVEGRFEWNDVGNWAAIEDLKDKDEDGNVIEGNHIAIDTKNCLIVGGQDRIIATIGLEDMIVVDTEDALLICRRDRAQDVKKVVDMLREHNMDEYL